MTSPATALLLELPVADGLGHVPWWEVVLLAAAIVAVSIYATGGSAAEPEKRGASEAASHETRDIDRTLTTHAIGLLQVVTFLAAGFVTAVKIGSLSTGVAVATLAALLTTSSLAGWALALVGKPMLIGSLHEDARAKQATEAIRRVHRRSRLLAVATWCGYPTVALTVICGSLALLDKAS